MMHKMLSDIFVFQISNMHIRCFYLVNKHCLKIVQEEKCSLLKTPLLSLSYRVWWLLRSLKADQFPCRCELVGANSIQGGRPYRCNSLQFRENPKTNPKNRHEPGSFLREQKLNERQNTFLEDKYCFYASGPNSF